MKKITFALLVMFFCIGSTSIVHAENGYQISKNGLEYLTFSGNKEAVIYLHSNPHTLSWVSVHDNPRTHSWEKRIISKGSDVYDMLKGVSEHSGKTTFAIARPGFGKSKGTLSHSLNNDSFTNKHLNEIVLCIKEIKKQYGCTSVTLMGYREGATLAAEIALRYPELISDVVLYDGAFDTDAWEWAKTQSKTSYEVNPMKLAVDGNISTVPFTIYYEEGTNFSKSSQDFARKLSGYTVKAIHLVGLKYNQGSFFKHVEVAEDIAAAF
jgi:pimeloyl-ACP methyl ester carboxylesterase